MVREGSWEVLWLDSVLEPPPVLVLPVEVEVRGRARRDRSADRPVFPPRLAIRELQVLGRVTRGGTWFLLTAISTLRPRSPRESISRPFSPIQHQLSTL